MSNEIATLDWLARNVSDWGDAFTILVSSQPARYYSVNYCQERMDFTGADCESITKHQWLARRAELQNKPSWKDAPEWADWLAQDTAGLDDLGAWWWYRVKPNRGARTWSGKGSSSLPAHLRGEVLGDWRDTLEKRPSYLSEQEVIARLKEATDNVLAAVPGLKSDKYKFQPFTSIEDNQELSMSKQQEVKQDNGWFERGELPPAGIECEALARGDAWKKVHTIGIDNEGAMVVQFLDDTIPYYGCTMPSRFRPIRTERELAIEEMKQHLPYPGSWDRVGLVYAAALYDAGYRKDPK